MLQQRQNLLRGPHLAHIYPVTLHERKAGRSADMKKKKMNRDIQVSVNPEVLKAITIKSTVCYDVLPCRLVATR